MRSIANLPLTNIIVKEVEMRKNVKVLMVVMGVTALMAAGCAKEEVVQKDEPIVQQQTVKQAEPAAPAVVPAAPAAPAAQPAAPVQEQAAAKAAEAVSLATVYFDFDKSDLRQDARDALSQNAEALLKKIADVKVKIEGHADERGSDEYNMALGDRRAKSAAKYLVNLGVKAERISTVSYGEEKPAVQGSDESAWSKNRRAEFLIVQ